MSLQIDGNHLPAVRKRRHDLAEHFGSGQPTVQQDQRFSGTVDFVIEIETIYGSVPGFEGSCHGCLSECRDRCRQDDPGSETCDETSFQQHGYVSSYLHVERRAAKSTGSVYLILRVDPDVPDILKKDCERLVDG